MRNVERDDRCCSPCHNRQPLSVALTKPCSRDRCDIPVSCEDDFASMQNHHGHSIKSCGCDMCDMPARCERDFASVQNHHGHGKNRRLVREYFSDFRPIAYYNSYWWAPRPMTMTQWAPAPALLPMTMIPWRSPSFHHGFGDGFFRHFGAVEIQEQRCRPCRCVVRCVHQPAKIVKQLTIRSRPTSCHDLREHHRHDKRVDVHHHINVNCNHASTASPPPPPPLPPRPSTTDTGTAAPTIEKSSRPPLTTSETERFDRFEEEKTIKQDKVITKITQKTCVVEEPVKVTTYECRKTSNYQRADAVNQVERSKISIGGYQQIGGYQNSGEFQQTQEFQQTGGHQQIGGFQNSEGFQQTQEFQQIGGFQNSGGFQQTQEFQQTGGHQQSGSFRRIGCCEQTGSGVSTSVCCSSDNVLNEENRHFAYESLSPCIRSIDNASKTIDSIETFSCSTQPFITQKTSETRRIVTSN
ncbi:unnamed protein product [Rotaria socialis]|uniref:Uncharacterized protein n=1 Tax=Rotaria socialis TaxID=392032 RepID=A0A818IZL4_9BILA|nr:unnamed protein product [Rotaria socialis]CAF3533122.1 unnamed protein product [Rotaria socialis]CAF4388181.1 unnamed protein product [Rotaria socialis]CAF4412633.1 unnamed protein product [Rotaria socialis]